MDEETKARFDALDARFDALTERSMRARVEYVIRASLEAGLTPEQITLAVFSALKEPTEAMVEEARWEDGEHTARVVWREMINAALAEAAP